MNKFILMGVTCALGFGIGWQIKPSDKTSTKFEALQQSTVTNSSGRNAAPKIKSDLSRGSVVSTKETHSIQALLKRAFEEDQEFIRAMIMVDALKQLNQDSLPVYTDFLNSKLLVKKDFHLWLLFLSAWGDFDGEGAMYFVHKKFKDPSKRLQLYIPIVKSWKNYAPREAVIFTAGLVSEDSQFDTSLAMSLLNTLLDSGDLDKALGYALRMGNDEFVLYLTGNYMSTLAGQDLAAANEVLDRMPEGESRVFATAEYIKAWSVTAPVDAAAWLIHNFPDNINFETLRAVSVNYLKQSPEAAMDWAYNLPDELFSKELLVAMVDEWARIDSNGVQNWLSLYESGEELDPVITAYSLNLAKESPSLALDEWVPQIHNKMDGQSTYYQVAMDWQKKRPGCLL